MRSLAMALAVGMTWALPATAEAARKPQIVTITVQDTNGKPIPNAWVRVPETEGRRDVEPYTGIWETSLLYTLAGEEILFLPKMDLDFTVSAPGFVAQRFLYRVRTNKNVLLVRLEPMPATEIVPRDDQADDLLLDWYRRAPTEAPPPEPE